MSSNRKRAFLAGSCIEKKVSRYQQWFLRNRNEKKSVALKQTALGF